MIIRTEISMLTVSGIQLHGGHGHPCSIRFHPIQDLYCLRRHVGLFLLFLTTRKIAKSTLHSNAFMIPVVYFFYPETAYRSLEEMDSIFRKCNSYFTVVKVARDEPRRYDKHGKPLVITRRRKSTGEGRARGVTQLKRLRLLRWRTEIMPTLVTRLRMVLGEILMLKCSESDM